MRTITIIYLMIVVSKIELENVNSNKISDIPRRCAFFAKASGNLTTPLNDPEKIFCSSDQNIIYKVRISGGKIAIISVLGLTEHTITGVVRNGKIFSNDP